LLYRLSSLPCGLDDEDEGCFAESPLGFSAEAPELRPEVFRGLFRSLLDFFVLELFDEVFDGVVFDVEAFGSSCFPCLIELLEAAGAVAGCAGEEREVADFASLAPLDLLFPIKGLHRKNSAY